MYRISDTALNDYYGRNYYGEGTDYFDPPEWEEDEDDEIYRDAY